MLVMVAALCLSACDDPKQTEAKYTTHGKELFEQGDLVKASLEFKNALQINPAAAVPQYYLGLIAEKQHNIGAALDAFRKAADADPKNFDASMKAGQMVLITGDANAAMGYANQALAVAPEKPEGHSLKAAAFLLKNNLQEAEKEAKAALAIDPNNVDAIIVRAGTQLRGGKADAALASVDQGLATNPQSTDLLLLKLKLVFDGKKTADVEAVLRRLHEIDPQNTNYVIDLANQLSQANKLGDAEEVFRQAVAANPASDQLLSAYAGFLAAKKGVDQAIAEIKKLAGDANPAAKYVFLLEQLYITSGKLPEARKVVTELHDRSTSIDEKLQAEVELARMTYLEGDAKGALDQLNAVLQQDAGNETALLIRGALALQKKQFDNAVSDARNVLAKNVNSVQALGLLSQAYSAMGENDLAIDTTRRLARLAPTDVGVRLRLASLLSAKTPQDALEQIDAAMALRPDATELAVQKAEFLVRIGQPDKAEIIANTLVKDAKFGGPAHRILGQAALARSDYAGAIEQLSKAQAAGEPFGAVAPVLVAAYLRSGKVDDAVALLSDRIGKEPGDTNAARMLASVYMQKGDKQAAEGLLRKVIEQKPEESESYLQLAQIYTAEKRSKEAVGILEAASKRLPSDERVLTYTAIAYDTDGNIEGAKDLYEKILSQAPGNKVAANNLAALIADSFADDAKQLDRARQLVEQFRNSSDPLLIDTLGWVLARQGNFDDATILLAKASSLAPTNQQVSFHYAMALNGKGLPQKAKVELDKALLGNPDYRGIDEAKALQSALR
jgi:tetratricopeptide (TPR) repeat protein